MKFQLGWLRDHVDLPDDAADVGRRLTSLGLALDGLEGEGDAAVFDLDVTTNRPDCMSHVGVARELAANLGRDLTVPVPKLAEAESESTSDATSVEVRDPDLCPRYVARVVRGVTVGASPAWLAERLHACGVRPINVVVDVTNHVLLELGQPLHAFDLSLLAEERIVVRRAADGETIETLDGVERKLDSEMLVIADAKRPVAVAGVMGGADTEIRDETSDVLIESAYFDPRSIRRTSRELGLRSEASHRFERGADPEIALVAADRAAELLAELAGGTVLAGAVDAAAERSPRPEIALRAGRVKKVGGVEVPRSFVAALLPRLGFEILSDEDDALCVRRPSWRHDVTQEIDLVEEVLRHVGYDRIPSTLPDFREGAQPRQAWERGLAELRRSLVASGHQQAISLSFGDPAAQRPFGDSLVDGGWERRIELENPLAENLAVLRTSLVPALLATAANALRRGETDVRLFEEGHAFFRRAPKDKGPSPADERPTVALLATGAAGSRHFAHAPRDVDALVVKGALLDALAAAAGHRDDERFRVAPATIPGCAPGAGEVRLDGVRVGWFGRIHPDHLEPLDVRQPVFAAEADLTIVLPDEWPKPRFVAPSRFPRVTRDVSVLVDRNQSYGAIIDAVRERFATVAELDAFELFDRYEGEGVPEDRVSLTFAVSWRRADGTLRQEEVDELQQRLVETLESEVGATLRG